MRLFSEHGYSATSVAQIQEACGLTGGSGALYKHFSSKRHLLEAALTGFLEGLDRSATALHQAVADDIPVVLELIATTVWDTMAGQRAMSRIILRDLEALPDLLDRVWDRMMHQVYDTFAAWLEVRAAQGDIVVDDPAATAAVLLASLTYFQLLGDLIDRTPGNIERQRFLQSWIHSARATLQPTASGTGRRPGVHRSR
jgi:AcrR family transcriptional regulator